MADSHLITQAFVKKDNGSLEGPTKFGASFSEIVDTRKDAKYTLAEFFDNYLNFMNNTTFVYQGNSEPQNHKIGLWIDTGHGNGLDVD